MTTCKYCRKPIEWDRNGNGKLVPYNLDGTPHHRTCKPFHKFKAEQARREAEGLVLENPNQLHFPF